MDGFFENWTTQIRKGLLEFCLLRAILGDRLYGYDIVRRLRLVPGLVISEGTIYPILNRLRREGLLQTSLEESREGPARKYYQLTASGQRTLARMDEQWLQILQGVQDLQGDEARRGRPC
jgi:PadR family transcriptional regulator, regulatory protein PadR